MLESAQEDLTLAVVPFLGGDLIEPLENGCDDSSLSSARWPLNQGDVRGVKRDIDRSFLAFSWVVLEDLLLARTR